MDPVVIGCDVCNAEPNEPCRPECSVTPVDDVEPWFDEDSSPWRDR